MKRRRTETDDILAILRGPLPEAEAFERSIAAYAAHKRDASEVQERFVRWRRENVLGRIDTTAVEAEGDHAMLAWMQQFNARWGYAKPRAGIE
jgi:hypothetical protein